LHDTKHLDIPVLERTEHTIGPLGLANSSARLLPRGTVVFSRTAVLGKCSVIGREMATSQDFANYVCGERLHNRYLMHLLRNMQGEWQRLMAGSSSTHQTLYMPIFRDLQILLPPTEEQEKIAAVLDALEDRVRAERAVLSAFKRQREALVGSLLTGELRVMSDPRRTNKVLASPGQPLSEKLDFPAGP
jgi:type I restriction enzyme S subunit